MKRINRFYGWLCAALLLQNFACSHTDSKDSQEPVRNVIPVAPQPIGENRSGEYSGIVEEGKNVNAAFMADGRITKVLVKEGDRVRKGQILATLDDTDYQIGVNQLRTQYKQMTEEKKRLDEMYARHNVAPNDYEKFLAGYEQLGLQLKMTENKLGYTKLESPSDGYVSEKFMEPGELVGAGTPIVKITDDSRLVANVDLPLNVYLEKDKIAATYGLSPLFPDEKIPLTIESFTPDASNNMLYHMKLTMPAAYARKFSPGMNLRIGIDISTDTDNGYLIPARAVFEENGITNVWVINPSDTTIHKRQVETRGTPEGKMITVRGLSGNDMIVETGVKQLYDGEKVNLVKKSDFGL